MFENSAWNDGPLPIDASLVGSGLPLGTLAPGATGGGSLGYGNSCGGGPLTDPCAVGDAAAGGLTSPLWMANAAMVSPLAAAGIVGDGSGGGDGGGGGGGGIEWAAGGWARGFRSPAVPPPPPCASSMTECTGSGGGWGNGSTSNANGGCNAARCAGTVAETSTTPAGVATPWPPAGSALAQAADGQVLVAAATAAAAAAAVKTAPAAGPPSSSAGGVADMGWSPDWVADAVGRIDGGAAGADGTTAASCETADMTVATATVAPSLSLISSAVLSSAEALAFCGGGNGSGSGGGNGSGSDGGGVRNSGGGDGGGGTWAPAPSSSRASSDASAAAPAAQMSSLRVASGEARGSPAPWAGGTTPVESSALPLASFTGPGVVAPHGPPVPSASPQEGGDVGSGSDASGGWRGCTTSPRAPTARRGTIALPTTAAATAAASASGVTANATAAVATADVAAAGMTAQPAVGGATDGSRCASAAVAPSPGLARAAAAKEHARATYKARLAADAARRGDGDRFKRRRKGDPPIGAADKQARRLLKNQDSAAAARHAHEVYVRALEGGLAAAEAATAALATALAAAKGRAVVAEHRAATLKAMLLFERGEARNVPGRTSTGASAAGEGEGEGGNGGFAADMDTARVMDAAEAAVAASNAGSTTADAGTTGGVGASALRPWGLPVGAPPVGAPPTAGPPTHSASHWLSGGSGTAADAAATAAAAAVAAAATGPPPSRCPSTASALTSCTAGAGSPPPSRRPPPPRRRRQPLSGDPFTGTGAAAVAGAAAAAAGATAAHGPADDPGGYHHAGGDVHGGGNPAGDGGASGTGGAKDAAKTGGSPASRRLRAGAWQPPLPRPPTGNGSGGGGPGDGGGGGGSSLATTGAHNGAGGW